jgi:dihydrofolate reductase
MTISIIAAVAENNVIGKDNDLIWHIPEDLKRFKRITTGKPVIMGRKTYESLPYKPLPKRRNIVITKDKNIQFEGVELVHSPEEAIKSCKNEEEIFICGGAAIYKHFIDKADKMYLTKVFEHFEGDTFFPNFDMRDWEIIMESELFSDSKSELKYQFIDFIRRK